MGQKLCPMGHSYDEKLPECPVCKERTQFEKMFKKDKTQIERKDKTLMEEDIIKKVDHTILVGKEEKEIRRKLVGWIVTYSLDKYGKSYELYEGRNQIGRKEGNDIVINEPIISEPHALILYREGKFYIKDLASANGTKVNDKELEPDVSVELKDGDKITFAKIIEFYLRTCIPYKKEE
jgi:hypothetical protein